VDEIISELNLALSKCRGEIAARRSDDQAVEHLREAARKIEQALELLKSIE
jgi:hypothetical protein